MKRRILDQTRSATSVYFVRNLCGISKKSLVEKTVFASSSGKREENSDKKMRNLVVLGVK